MDYDFAGWATRNNIECSDGRTIMKDAFKQNDGQKVPLVWNHQHNDPNEVLGHALLENREEGVYAWCKFNNTQAGNTAKALVLNGDVDQLSIYANRLKSLKNQVTHGCIREVSLVLAGANPGAYIESVVVHGEGADAEEEVVIYTDEPISVDIEHSDEGAEEMKEDEKGGEIMEETVTKEEIQEETQNENQVENEVVEHSDKSNEETVEEIFNTFDALYHAGKQIVFASDRPLSAFELIPDRLRSRFEWGIEANIKVPDLETRMEIVKRHAQNSNFPISDDVALFLAKEYSTNIRELEGAYNKVSARASIEDVQLDVELTKEYLDFSQKKKKITVDNILETCAKYFSVDKKDILSTARAKEVVNARKYAIYLSRELLDLSYPNLAKEFNKNHTTIMYQHEKLKNDIETNKAMQIVTDELSELIKR